MRLQIQNIGHNSKFEILFSKMKVTKLNFNSYFQQINSYRIPVYFAG